ncbi:acetoacetate--CoA ligase [Nocardioides daeguensis]|uniref:Acetoacetate--CoA ligase n=1 Tax=Nocardioides daeguensis TaxID=908359 RepID=A0ABP6V524_9ACTN|nr:acetoacetate--CoA ligase [Nocardioides daeguensis]MBV6729699.1 acetoacetate--CoA ligase [Nocardioides daeguensis]MCR1774696.1 acetoacetate--CoA ligase [Nocardioides daeguensis]
MSRIEEFARFVGVPGDYDDLWAWSVRDLDAFWSGVARHLGFDLPGPVLAQERMPGAVWFPEARVSYAAAILDGRPDHEVAVVGVTEDPDATVELTWGELRRRTASLAATLRRLGVGEGDRVVGFLPNTPDAVVALLAIASLGAVWSVCGMDYAASAARARFEQLDPVVLVHASSYVHQQKVHDRSEVVAELVAALPTVRAVLEVGSPAWDAALAADVPFEPVAVAFDHPLWVLFSSGTTGKPKGIVHGHGGALLEQAKVAAYHFDLGPGQRLFWHTTPSWMMWNFVVGGLLTGASVVTYDGSPAHPTTDGLWALAARHGVSVVGMSPGYVAACQKARVGPARHDLSRLRRVGISGSTFPATSHEALQAELGPDVQICSISGGTDVVSAFVGSAPTLPVWPGELSRPCLGVALDAFDPAGRPVRGEVGELVVTRPMPSMPLYFWGDEDGSRYHDAYFDTYPGVWRHGDWITLTDHGSVVIHGRSDATLNRNGVRMGSGDIYEPVEALPEVREALVIGLEEPDGGYWMPLFVVLADGVELDAELDARIRDAVRTQASPRHVPDVVIAAPGIPHTRTGKKLEVPVKKVLGGQELGGSYDPGSVDDPELIDWYRTVGRSRRTR